MKIAIFGGTGFVGKRLVETLNQRGHSPLVLDVRRDANWRAQVAECDGVVNLAGSPLFKERWNSTVKSKIYDSRIDGTHKIVDALAGSKVKVLVNASAIGIYGASERDCNEDAIPADDFLARVCKAWEDAAKTAERHHKIRTAILRFGIILGKGGGAIQKLVPPFKLGMGGPIGSGHQSMSWVHIDDVVGLILLALENDKVRGPINVTSPNIVSNKAFSKLVGKILHRPAFIPVPKLALYALVGEAAGVIAGGQRAHPQQAMHYGYAFKFPQLEDALRDIL